MTQEEKQLLLQDLCARLPYGIFVKDGRNKLDDDPVIYTADYHPCINDCKPFLRPMSSMTEEEKKEFQEYVFESNEIGDIVTLDASDWLNKKMFDYRGLIPMGLALEAPEDMYNTKTE